MKAKLQVYAMCILLSATIFQCKKSEHTDSSTPQNQVTVTTSLGTKTATTITASGTVTAPSGTSISERGICFNASATDPTITDQKISSGSGTGAFTITLTNLTPYTSYWFRAYALTSSGVVYGDVLGTMTLHQLTVPTLTLNPIISQFSTNATLEADFIDTGYAPITAKGFCWSTSPNPTIANTTLPQGSGYEFGYFSGSTYSLTVHTTYYFRAYATNSEGTGYSNELSLTTAYHIGEGLGGGRIFYVDGTGLHGLVAALTDQSNGGKWNNTTNPFSWINAYDLNNGSVNTTNIIAAIGNNGSAASVCRSYTGGGYTDWYLPSANELYQLYLHQSVFGNFFAYYYWSSTASNTDNSTAYVQDFGSGSYDLRFKSEIFPVRAIRAF